MKIEDIDTPAVLVDLDIALRNISRAQQQAVLRLGAGARVQATEHAQFGGEGIAHHGGAVL